MDYVLLIMACQTRVVRKRDIFISFVSLCQGLKWFLIELSLWILFDSFFQIDSIVQFR